MEPIIWIFIVIMGIGAIIVGAIGLTALFFWWWWLIPLIGALAGGFLGFVFGLGLAAIIGVIVLIIKAAFETKT